MAEIVDGADAELATSRLLYVVAALSTVGASAAWLGATLMERSEGSAPIDARKRTFLRLVKDEPDDEVEPATRDRIERFLGILSEGLVEWGI